MRKEVKHEVVSALTEQMKASGNFYITDTSSLTVAKINNIRRKWFENEIGIQVVKNTLIRKALEQLDGDVAPLFDVLKGSSSVMFSTNANAPAKLIKELRKAKEEKPILKAAYVESTVFIGDNQLEA